METTIYNPRVAKISTIKYDKKKPYTVFSHFQIISGNSAIGIKDSIYLENRTFGKLGSPNRKKFQTEQEAKKELSIILVASKLKKLL